ncbi:MAG TPA: VanZ family protein [Pseudonocardiaceae bacterium]|nr:VanZ family protein [Pseudonocardiaceae bacterium]
MSDLDLHAILYLTAHHPEVPAAFAAGSLLLGGAAWWLAPRWGWAQVPAVLAGCGLALALAVTVVRPVGLFSAGGLDPLVILRECVVGSLSLVRTYEKLNVTMLMPFAFFATVATRRPAIIAGSCLLISGAVEFVQGATGGGTCQASDLVHNAAGGVLGVLLAAVPLLLLVRRSRGITADLGAGPGR